MGDIFGPEFESHLLELKTLQDYVKLYGARDLQFEPGPAYGFGFQLEAGEVRTYGHGGAAPGTNGILRVYPYSGQSVIVLCNLDSPSASRIGDWLHARIPIKSR